MSSMLTSFSENEHKIWEIFLANRAENISQFACKEFKEGLIQLELPIHHIPDHNYISSKLIKKTGWKVKPIYGGIKNQDFFYLLSQKIFPVAQKIRSLKELEFYDAPGPDLIHDYFGHCPLLMNEEFSNFMQTFSKLITQQRLENHIVIERFYWYTIEFGLVETKEGVRAYGAGILPSTAEIDNALKNKAISRRLFNLTEIARTPIDIGKKQSVYYINKNLKQLHECLNFDWKVICNEIDNYVI